MPARTRRPSSHGWRNAPARCMQCSLCAVLPVRRVQQKKGALTWYGWQVRCWQCGNRWVPDYPLTDLPR